MATTFVDVDEACGGSEQCFANNSDVQLWAITVQSYSNGVPEAVVIAEWIAEGTFSSSSSGAVCNNPGNSETGTYSGCGGLSFTLDTECTAYPEYYQTDSGGAAAQAQGEILAASSNYCGIAEAANQSTLTSGGKQLKEYAEQNGWTIVPTGWYNASYAWGASPWDGSGHYRASNYAGASPSTVDGSALIYFIQSNGLYNLA